MNTHEQPNSTEAQEGRFCIKQKDGKFQWRWMVEHYETKLLGPEFDSYEQALAYGKARWNLPDDEA